MQSALTQDHAKQAATIAIGVSADAPILMTKLSFASPDAAMQVSRILATERGVELTLEAFQLALQGCRRDIELECLEAFDDGERWWDTEAAPFTNSACENDLEFLHMRLRSIAFLEANGAIQRHHQFHHWIKFVDLV